MGLRIECLKGDSIGSGVADLARLRIRVFRAWPYLYDGDLAYEEAYLSGFAKGQTSVIVAAYDVDTIVGAATGSPLEEHTAEFVPLFAGYGYRAENIFYCGESVLLPEYRAQGIGHGFFDRREAHARELRDKLGYQFEYSSFCSVIREGGDLRCPPGYRPLDSFWEKRGYRKVAGMIGHYNWREIGQVSETRKPMQFWMRKLD